MVAIAAAVLVTFIGGLYFITHHKKEESETLQSQKVTGNGLPPKPEERWRYIKELESRQPGVRAPTEPSAGGEVKTPEQLTPEQRQLLEQMQADMRQQPTQLVEVPWNEQTPEQRQQTLQRQRQAQQLAEQQRLAQQSRTTEQSWQQQTRTSQAAPVQAQPRQSKPASSQQPYQDLLQTPAHTTAQSKPQQAAPVARAADAPKPTAEKKDERRWMVQCGSFRGAEQAETVRAQLAFENHHQQWLESCGHWPGERQRERRQHPQSVEDGGSYKLHSARRRGLKPSKSPPSIIALCPVLLYGVCTLYS